jgi:processive 1,2-diacylglycerol beta-glucosyltransferase
VQGRAPRVQIFSAAIGEGHDGPARQLSAGLRAINPDTEIEVVDFLGLVPLVGAIAMGSSQFHSTVASWIFDGIFWLVNDVEPTRRLMNWGLTLLSRRRMRATIEAFDPDVAVATYPGATLVLGDLRVRGLLRPPSVSAITDLAALRAWTHPAVDLHLITHPESADEVRELAPSTEIRAVSGFTSPGFERKLDPATARAALDLPASGPVVVVSGGGWAVGDLEGAISVALETPWATVVCLAGRNDEVRAELDVAFAGEQRVRLLPFTDRIAELFAAADVLVHSTAGLTVLEALISGCRVISYGWGHGHVRVNNHAFIRFGLAEVATDRAQLRAALERALAAPREPEPQLAELPPAAGAVYELATRGAGESEVMHRMGA